VNVAGNLVAAYLYGDGSNIINVNVNNIVDTPNYVAYFDSGTGVLSAEAQVTSQQGGLGINAASSSGLPKFAAGVATIATG